jgi:hypothetical protein
VWAGYYTGFVGKQLSWEDIAYNVGHPVRFRSDKIRRDLLPAGFIPPAQTFADMYDNLQAAGIIPLGN